jgi:addiction module RelE/StbE family toxin
MNVVFHKSFEKTVNKLPPKVKQKMIERLSLFSNDPLNRQLRNHALNTPYKGSYSIDITGDYRAIYELVDEDTSLFTHIGTHSQLYR